jgi:hypothetical protein
VIKALLVLQLQKIRFIVEDVEILVIYQGIALHMLLLQDQLQDQVVVVLLRDILLSQLLILFLRWAIPQCLLRLRIIETEIEEDIRVLALIPEIVIEIDNPRADVLVLEVELAEAQETKGEDRDPVRETEIIAQAEIETARAKIENVLVVIMIRIVPAEIGIESVQVVIMIEIVREEERKSIAVPSLPADLNVIPIAKTKNPDVKEILPESKQLIHMQNHTAVKSSHKKCSARTPGLSFSSFLQLYSLHKASD